MKRMQVNGLYAEVNTPIAPEGEGNHGLPPYDRQNHYVVEEYPACPDNWVHGSAKASSYFVAIKPGRHLWLDFNQNSNHTHHVAAVISVQGINPITGQQTKELRLEQYHEKCPVHDNDFGQDRYCEKCGYKWPAQNYLSTTSTPNGQFWIDGFRAEDGTVRGFLITEDTVRGVAKQLIGEDRVYAIGIAFYLSKEKKPQPPQRFLRTQSFGNHQYISGNFATLSCNDLIGCSDDMQHYEAEEFTSGGLKFVDFATEAPKFRSIIQKSIETKKLEIGAGAKINQELSYPDKEDLNFYEDEPAGMIYVNYCTPEDCDSIIKAGKKDLTKGGEGFLSGLKTGN